MNKKHHDKHLLQLTYIIMSTKDSFFWEVFYNFFKNIMKYSCRCILVKICNHCITCVILSSFHSRIFVRFVLFTLVLSVTCVLLIIVWPFDLFIWPLYYVSGDWSASNYPCGLLRFFLTWGKYNFWKYLLWNADYPTFKDYVIIMPFLLH